MDSWVWDQVGLELGDINIEAPSNLREAVKEEIVWATSLFKLV